jgi:hypothetical protein
MPPISDMFAYHGRPGSQFYEEDLKAFLCPQPLAGEKPLSIPLMMNSGTIATTAQGKYEFMLEKSEDGKTIALDATLTRGDQVYKTAMKAVQVQGDLYQITQLTFDNKPERLKHRWEIAKVLAHIGKEQLQKACRGELPEAHEERGKFGKFRRFLNSLMPNDPTQIPPPAC